MRHSRPSTAGATLVEVIVASAIIALGLAISYPSAIEAVESTRVRGSADQARALFVGAGHFADRHRQAVLVRIRPEARRLELHSEDGQLKRSLEFPSSLRVVEPSEDMEVVILPGGSLPSVGIVLASSRGTRAGFRTDPLDGRIKHWEGGE